MIKSTEVSDLNHSATGAARLQNMDNSILNYRIFKWSSDVCGRGCKNWCFNFLAKMRGFPNHLENPNKNIVKML